MDNSRWDRLQALFHEALGRPESERRAFAETACGGDSDMLSELLNMLEADSATASVLDQGLPEMANRMLQTPEAPVPFGEFGPYRLKNILGEGGMGVVWLAERRDAGNLVAIKFLPHAGLSPSRRQRFAQEIKTLGKLKHPYIARLYDAGNLGDGTPWFVMEYVEGVRLTEYCHTTKLGVEEKLRLFRAVCEAVQHAHGQEIIHRDLKPSNILVEPDGTPRLLDFGIAKELQNMGEGADETRPGLRFLSPDYAAPEWMHEGRIGFFTDVYSLGVILYEMLVGRLPGESPGNPSGIADFDVLCLKAMHQDASQRYPSVEALLRDVDHYLKQEPLEARPGRPRYRMAKFFARNRRAVLATAAGLAVALALVAFFTVRLLEARDRVNRETAITAAMNRFLSDDLLGQTDPFKSRNAKESFNDVVQRASLRIDPQFATEPLVAARLHQTIARALDRRSDFPPARQEYARAAELFRLGEGAQSSEALVVVLQRAAMEARSRERGSLEIAKSLVAGAQDSMSRMDRPPAHLAVWLLNARGTIALVENDSHLANADFSAALRQAEPIPTFDASARRSLRLGLAITDIHLGDGAKAEQLLQEIMEECSKIGGPDSPDALRAGQYLSQALMVQHKYSQAIDNANLIYPMLVEELGEDHEVVMAVLGTKAASEGYLEMWDGAVRDDLTLYRLSLQKQGAKSFFTIGALSDAALSQCRAGRYLEGEANARKALEESRRTFGPREATTGAVSFTLAFCLTRMNKRLDEASDILRNIDVPAVAQLAADPTVYASVAMAQAEIAVRQGDYAAARRYADTAAPAYDNPSASRSDRESLQKR
jgi:serine/threonine-protein kinase